MDLAIALDSNAAVPLHRQLYEELRRAILSGRLLPRQRIPSTRTLAKSLGISRTTVLQSYEQLFSEGYIQAIVGSGTFVCAQLPDDLLRSTPVESAQKIARHASFAGSELHRLLAPQIKLSKYAASLAKTNVPGITEPNAPISFRYGRPAFDQFPMKLWRKLLSRHCRSNPDWLQYGSDN